MDYIIKIIISIALFLFLASWLFTYLGSKSSRMANSIYRKEITRQRQAQFNSLDHHKC